MNNIGIALKHKRLAMGLSRDKLSRLTDVTPKSIKDAEDTGLPSVRTLLRLCDALGLEVVIKEKEAIRPLTDAELAMIAECVAEDALKGNNRTFVSINDDVDVIVDFKAEISQYQEIGCESGTGAWIVDDFYIKITCFDVEKAEDADYIETPALWKLEEMIKQKIMEG